MLTANVTLRRGGIWNLAFKHHRKISKLSFISNSTLTMSTLCWVMIDSSCEIFSKAISCWPCSSSITCMMIICQLFCRDIEEFQIWFYPKQTYQMILSHLTFSFFSMVICTFSWSWLIFFSKSFLAPLRFKSFSRHSALWATTWKKFQNSWYFGKYTANIPPGSAAQLPSWSSHRWVCPSSPQTLSSPCLNISYPNRQYILSSVLIMFQLPNIF